MFDSPLRYPGGKARLTQHVIDLLEMNGLVGGHYVEPYTGGAGIAIPLLYMEFASHLHLNDLNPSVYAFWKSVLDHADEMARMVREVPLTVEEWRLQRAIQFQQDRPSLLELGFSTFYLNRTSRSGIIRGGVIGGINQDGKWKIDARYNREALAMRIEKIASYRSRISLYNMDAADLIRTVLPDIPERSLVYLDPPYYENGSKLYQNSYQHDDHENIAKQVSDIPQPWIVSYDNVEPIRQFYSAYRQQTFGLRYSAQRVYEGVEVMVYGDTLKIPGQIRPCRRVAA